ncbi:PGPGW domain-containing protein [Spirillospora sp. CA-294931]|uniref:PGPGW domain-containing protein n=1 Tax=Spirillospora sp. CA-294931 TaxID=3240042 RepID=UPI003D8B3397
MITETRPSETDVVLAPKAPRKPGGPVRKIAVAVAGITVILAGVVMMVLPGPGVVAILAGFGILGTEFPAARRVSERLNDYARAAWRKIRRPKAQ